MVEAVRTHEVERTDGRMMWLCIDIQPRRVVLFRRWARHLGVSDAELAARIFTEGTVGLALDQMTGVSLALTADEDTRHVERLLDDLERYLEVAPNPKESPDAPDHD